MVRSIIMNKKWQKVIFIICSMIYTCYGLIAFTMFKKWPGYENVNLFFNTYAYRPFQFLAIIAILDRFIQFKEKYNYGMIKAIPLFIINHIILIVIFVFCLINYNIMLNQESILRITTLQFIFYYLLAASQYDFSEYLPYLLIASVAFMCVTLVCFRHGLLIDVLYDRGGGVIGHSLGYIWPLTFYAHFLIIVLMYLTLRKEKFSLIELIAIGAGNYYLGKVTTAKTGTILVYLAILLAYALHFEGICRLFDRCLSLVYAWLFVAPIGSLLSSIFYPNSSLLQKVNGHLNHRLEMQYNALQKYGFQPFGQSIRWKSFGAKNVVKPGTYNFVDNAFMKVSFDYGYSYVVMLVAGFVYAIHHFYEKENETAIMCIAVLFLFGIFQTQFLLIGINPFLLSISGAMMLGIDDIRDFFR